MLFGKRQNSFHIVDIMRLVAKRHATTIRLRFRGNLDTGELVLRVTEIQGFLRLAELSVWFADRFGSEKRKVDKLFHRTPFSHPTLTIYHSHSKQCFGKSNVLHFGSERHGK